MLNLTVMTGRLTADPELRYTEGGNIPVCNFSIANQRRFANADGERETDFFNYVAWRSNAEFICKYFKKGSLITLVSSAQTRRYQENETGKTRVVVEFVVNQAQFAESKKAPMAESPAQMHLMTSLQISAMSVQMMIFRFKFGVIL